MDEKQYRFTVVKKNAPAVKRGAWDILVEVLAWLFLALPILETIGASLATITLPPWLVWFPGVFGGGLHLLRIIVKDSLLMTPAKKHNIGAFLLALLAAIATFLAVQNQPPSAALPDQVQSPTKDIIEGKAPSAPQGFIHRSVQDQQATAAAIPFLFMGGLAPIATRKRFRIRCLPGRIAVVLGAIAIVMMTAACARLPDQVRKDGVSAADLYTGYVTGDPSLTQEKKDDRLRLAAQWNEVGTSGYASWSYKDVAQTITCQLERYVKADTNLAADVRDGVLKMTRAIRVGVSMPAACPAAGGVQ